MRIPFKTLRFERGDGRIWGVNFSRRIRRKNEIDYWSPVPRVYNLYRAGLAGTLTGLPDASQGRNLRLKPWVGGRLDARGRRRRRSTRGAHAGLDVKYGVTPSLTLDVTVKPDFAQAEADEQQVNLTQFSLFFPEKREFFLENSGMFYFGDIPRESRLGNARFAPPEEEMLLFFSRRIGLTDAGEEIPIAAGGRLTGRVGGTGVGADDDPDAVGRRRATATTTPCCAAGATSCATRTSARSFCRGSRPASSSDRNEVAGVDANFRFIKALSINGFLAKSFTPGVERRRDVRQGLDRLERQLPAHAVLAAAASATTSATTSASSSGTGIRKHFADFGIRFRPEWWRKFGIRELHPHTRYNIYTDQSNVKVTHTNHVAMAWFFENGGYLELQWNPRFERIVAPFKVRPDQSFAPGSYGWNEYALELETNHSRKVSASALITTGGFWNGTQQSMKVGRDRTGRRIT